MASSELVIINKESQGEFPFHGGTVTIHPVSVSAYKAYVEFGFEKFPLLDDPNVKCLPKLINRTRFEIHFDTKDLLANEYEISLYYFQKPCKLIHVKTVNMVKILPSSICKLNIPNLGSDAANIISESYLLCTKICRKDIPYVFEEMSSTLDSSQVTDCTSLFENTALTNFKIVIEDREFLVHKEILAAKSPVFLAMLESAMNEKKENQMIIKDVDSNVFQELLRYIYSNTVKELETHAEKLLKAADKYDIRKLKLLCSEELSRSLNIENAIHLLELSDQYHESTLKERALKFIQSNIEQIMQTENYKKWRQTAPPYLMDDILSTIVDLIKSYPGAYWIDLNVNP